MKRIWLAIAAAAAGAAQVPHEHHPPDSAEYARVLEDPQLGPPESMEIL